MTREQIEQKAREHAPEPTPYNLGISVGNDIKRASFIAGAESRNAEIAELVEVLKMVKHGTRSVSFQQEINELLKKYESEN